MLYKATVSFSGVQNMVCGEVRELTEPSVINDLLKAGYIIPMEIEKVEKPAKPKRKGKKNDED